MKHKILTAIFALSFLVTLGNAVASSPQQRLDDHNKKIEEAKQQVVNRQKIYEQNKTEVNRQSVENWKQRRDLLIKMKPDLVKEVMEKGQKASAPSTSKSPPRQTPAQTTQRFENVTEYTLEISNNTGVVATRVSKLNLTLINEDTGKTFRTTLDAFPGPGQLRRFSFKESQSQLGVLLRKAGQTSKTKAILEYEIQFANGILTRGKVESVNTSRKESGPANLIPVNLFEFTLNTSNQIVVNIFGNTYVE